MNQKRRCCIFRCVCMTPWISQALCECQGSAVLTHRNLRTVEKPVGRGKCGLAEGRRGREEAGWNPFFLLSLHFHWVMEQWLYSPLPKTSVLLQGSSADSGVSQWCIVWLDFFLFFFSSRPSHLSASWNWEHILCKKFHLGKSLYLRSSQLTLTLVSEIVLLLFQVTPKIAT